MQMDLFAIDDAAGRKNEPYDYQRAYDCGLRGDDKIADGDYQGAIADLSEAIGLDPRNAQYYGLRGVAYYELGRYREALADYDKSIALCPSPHTLYNRAEALYKTGRDKEALADLEQALRLIKWDFSLHFIFRECRKLMDIIANRSVSPEAYYQAPVGWENKGKKRRNVPERNRLDDVAHEVLSFLYRSMCVDHEWAVVAERGFTWWGEGLAQRIWAEECRCDDGVDVTLVHVETDFLRNVKDNDVTFERLNDLNEGVTQFSFVFYPTQGRIALHSTVYTHRQSLEWTKRLLLCCAGLQVSSAHLTVGQLAPLFEGAEADVTPHPESGSRRKPDELVYLIKNFFLPASEKAHPLDAETFALATEHLHSDYLPTADEDGLTAEFPFTGCDPAVVRLAKGLEGAVTSLFEAFSGGRHWLIGRGLTIRLSLPVSLERRDALEMAAALNRFEATNWVKCHLNGAWYVDENSHLMFVSFYPLAYFQSWQLVNLAWSCLIRSQMAGEVFSVLQGDFDTGMSRMLQ